MVCCPLLLDGSAAAELQSWLPPVAFQPVTKVLVMAIKFASVDVFIAPSECLSGVHLSGCIVVQNQVNPLVFFHQRAALFQKGE